MKTEYDLVFGVGNACSCSQAIRAARLQFASFPFDWNVCLLEDDLPVRAELLCNGFAHWLDENDLRFVSQNAERAEMDVYENRRTRFLFLHDFDRGVPLATSFACVQEKYRRRIQRLLTMIRASRRVLIVRLDRPDQKVPTTVEACSELRRHLTEHFAGVSFDVVLFSLERGRAFADRRIERPSAGVIRIAFDYTSAAPGAPAYLTASDLTGAALASVARMRDYRTPQERRDYELRRKRVRWAKLGATTFWGYQLARIKKVFAR